MNKKNTGIMAAVLGSFFIMTGCQDVEEPIDHAFDGERIEAPLAPMATLEADGQLTFASDEVAREWTQEAPGVWRHQTTEQRLAIGERGHRFIADQLADELAAMYQSDADLEAIAAKEAQLAGAEDALVLSNQTASLGASCDITTYNGPSSPFTGFVGAAGLVQIVCYGGTVVFSVNSQACTGTYGCSSVNYHTAIADSIPRIWGTARSGYGYCSSFVSVSPSGVYDSRSYFCD